MSISLVPHLPDSVKIRKTPFRCENPLTSCGRPSYKSCCNKEIKKLKEFVDHGRSKNTVS